MGLEFDQKRRNVLKTACLAVGAATLGRSVRAFAAGGPSTYPQPPGAPQPHDTFVYSEGPKKGQDVKTADIVLDTSPVAVHAKNPETGAVRESEHSAVLVFRVKEDTIPIEWRGDSAGGILAYSAICTYDATEIQPKDWDAVNKHFNCPTCKTSYDAVNGAEVTSGPGKRALPQVPIKDHDGLLRISHGVIGWIGLKRR